LTATQSPPRPAPPGGYGFALFARDFDAPLDNVIVLDDAEEESPQAEPPPPPITQAMLDAAVEAARAEGLREGRAEAADAREAARHAMQATLINQLRDAETQLRGAVEEAGGQLAALVLAMLDAGFPALRARHGAAELSRFTRDIVGLLAEEPRIVIRIHPDLRPALDEVLGGLEPERREAILVEAREALPPGDARIAWRHGMAVRDTEALRLRLAETLAPLGLEPAAPEHISTTA
jgi:flagellar assembly protein FliH